eukprot:6398574-Amphidinium_carterae.1
MEVVPLTSDSSLGLLSLRTLFSKAAVEGAAWDGAAQVALLRLQWHQTVGQHRATIVVAQPTCLGHVLRTLGLRRGGGRSLVSDLFPTYGRITPSHTLLALHGQSSHCRCKPSSSQLAERAHSRAQVPEYVIDSETIDSQSHRCLVAEPKPSRSCKSMQDELQKAVGWGCS